MLDYIFKLNDCFNKTCQELSDIFKVSFDATEKDIDRPLTDDEKKLCILFGLLYILGKCEHEKDH